MNLKTWAQLRISKVRKHCSLDYYVDYFQMYLLSKGLILFRYYLEKVCKVSHPKMSKTELAFANQKKSAFSGQDLSRKGSVDEPIQDLVAFINSLPQYFTTSSCSGRILLFADIPSEVLLILKLQYKNIKTA